MTENKGEWLWGRIIGVLAFLIVPPLILGFLAPWWSLGIVVGVDVIVLAVLNHFDPYRMTPEENRQFWIECHRVAREKYKAKQAVKDARKTERIMELRRKRDAR